MQPLTMQDLPPEVQALVGSLKSARTPVRRQLDDLRIQANPKDNIGRPSFFYESVPEEKYEHQDYPALRFRLENGKVVERCITSLGEDVEALTAGWLKVPPLSAPKSRDEQLQDELAALSDEDREWVLAAMRDQRRSALMQKLAGLTEAEIATVTGGEPAPKRRGPGRPPKVTSDGA